jgi:hypothetical protein
MLSEDNRIYNRLSEEINMIHPPKSLHQSIRNRILQDTQNSKSGMRKFVLIPSLLGVMLILLMGSGFISPAMANVLHKIPVVGVIYNDFALDIGLENAKKLGITEHVQKSDSSNKVELTITDVFYDGTTLSFAYRLKNNNFQEWEEQRFLILDGKKEFSFNGSKVHGGFDEKFKKTKDNEYEGTVNIYPMDFPKEDNFTLGIHLTELQGMTGKWEIKVPVSKKKVKDSVKAFSPNYKTSGIGAEILIKSVDFTPTGIGLTTETIAEMKEVEILNPKTGKIEKRKKPDVIFFSIKQSGADQGVTGESEALGNGKALTRSKFVFPAIKKVPKSITVIAYRPDDSSRFEFEVPLYK